MVRHHAGSASSAPCIRCMGLGRNFLIAAQSTESRLSPCLNVETKALTDREADCAPGSSACAYA